MWCNSTHVKIPQVVTGLLPEQYLNNIVGPTILFRIVSTIFCLAMMKQQGCSWLLETGKISIDRNALLFMFMHYFWHGCLNLLTSYYSNDPVSKLEFPAIVLNLKIDSTSCLPLLQTVSSSANQDAGFVKPSRFILKCDIILCDLWCVACMHARSVAIQSNVKWDDVICCDENAMDCMWMWCEVMWM